MVIFKSTLSHKEKKHIRGMLFEVPDLYGDFYLTRDNLRLFIKENQDLLFRCLNKGDKIAYNEQAMAVICGFSDKAPRKYLKILAKNLNDVSPLLKVIAWHLDCDLFVKLKKNNPLRNVLEKNYFRFVGGRGREILFVRRKRKSWEQTPATTLVPVVKNSDRIFEAEENKTQDIVCQGCLT